MAQETVVVDIALLGKMAGYIEMLVKDPHSTVFAVLSDIYRTFGLLEEAAAVAQKGSEMLPTYVPGYVALGRALAEQGDSAAAVAAYRRALALDPGHLAALTGLASSCLGCGESAEALTTLERAQLIDPEDEVVKQLLAVVKKLAALPPAAAMIAPLSLPLPEESYVPSSLAPQATQEESSGESSHGAAPLPPIATATLADIYIKQGFFDKALKVFKDLLVEDPENREIAQRYQELGRQMAAPESAPAPVAAASAPPEEATITTTSLPLEQRSAEMAAGSGKDALIALYGRWLDAVHRRQADVH